MMDEKRGRNSMHDGEYRLTKEQLAGLGSATQNETNPIDGEYHFPRAQMTPRSKTAEGGQAFSLEHGVLTVYGTSKTASGIRFRALPQREPVPEVEVLVLQEGIEHIEKWAFANYPNLKKVVFPSTLKKIGGNSFDMCTGLQELRIPDSVEEIDFCAFQNCSALYRVTLPSRLRVLHGSAFYQDSALKEINIPEGVRVLENGLFQGCTALETVKIPESVTEIEDYAFADSGIKSLRLPSTLTKVGNMVFSGSALRELYIENKELRLGFINGVTDHVHVIRAGDHRIDHKAPSSNVVYGSTCPRCHSTRTTSTRRHRVFSIIKALLFMFLCPPLFLLGFIGSTRAECSCQACGQTWTQKPGKFSLNTLGEWFMYL